MPENDAEHQVRMFFESQRFHVDRIISLQDERRADYRVTHENEVYIVEVKGRIEDKEYERDLLEQGEAIREGLLGYTNPASKQIREAAKQLIVTPAEPSAFRVIALVTAYDDPETHAEQFQSTLYGMVDLLIPAENGHARAIPCYYFTFSEFYNLPEVDAALILIPGGAKICLNSFSTRLHEFRKTSLCQLLASVGAVSDPEEREKQGKAYIADCSLDRRDESLIREYVRRKYKLTHLPPHLPMTFSPTKLTVGKMVRKKTD